jgi:U4/U6.U5 tri-snRNP-associated protein 1
LKGKSLADLDADEGDVDDARKWIKRSKKQEKILAKKRQEELDNMDKAALAEYGESTMPLLTHKCLLTTISEDLTGLKVSHDFTELEEGRERILTLKDSRILDGEEDELQNVEMAEAERHQKNQDLKIKKPQYTGYDDDEFVEGSSRMKKSVLSKYDEELEGSKDTASKPLLES